MKDLFIRFALILALIALPSCRRNPSRSRRAADRIVSPAAVDIAGIRFDMTPDGLRDLLPSIRCETNDTGTALCTWRSSGADRKGKFRGIDRMKFRFYRNNLRMIRLEYAEMLDLEYSVFDADVRNKYAYRPSEKALDSTVTDWRYDSLVVVLNPNHHPHWIGQVTTFTPVLELVRP